MADESQAKVDKKIRRVENRINEIYGQARLDIESKIDEFNRGFETRNSIHLQELANGTITQSQYDAWLRGQVFQSEQWRAKRDQICGILDTANQQATTIVNGGTIGAFAEGANWTAYSLEHTAGVNFGFGLYDRATVTRLLVDNPQILPEWRIDEPKEYVWNQRLVNNCVTQGIIQGESLGDIATRIATATSNQNRNLALTHARTAMTGAQNAGRVQRLQDAKKMGLKVVKEWLATLDAHTRDSHRDMDGEQRPVGDQWHPMKFSNGCRYPGDPQGPAHEVYNCRCTLTGDLADFPDAYKRYDNIDGKPVEAMSYREWEKTKTPAKPVEVVSAPVSSELFTSPSDEVARILSRYESLDEMINNMTDDEYEILEPILVSRGEDTVEEWMRRIHTGEMEVTTEIPYLEDINDFWKLNDIKVKKYDQLISSLMRHYNLNEEEAQAVWDRFVQTLVDQSELGMRIDGDRLISALNDGRFKNQFETNTSHGALTFTGRRDCENNVFNVPYETAGADRPVYGMLFPRVDDFDLDNASRLTQDFYISKYGDYGGVYGDCIVIFRRENVINNATMTIGDSLNTEMYAGATSLANPVGVPAGGYMGNYFENDFILHPEQPRDVHITRSVSSWHGYCEIQLHGAESHNVSNIEFVYVRRNNPNSAQLVSMLEERGISYSYI